MKRLRLVSTCVVTVAILMASCTKEKELQAEAVTAQTTDPTIRKGTDGSGGGLYSGTRTVLSDVYLTNPFGSRTIEVTIWQDYTDGQHNDMEVPVDSGYVLIGGGARVTNLSNNDAGVNALLVDAHPANNNNFASYIAHSKDHQIGYYHRLWCYAIGMKVFGYNTKSGSWTFAAADVRSIMNLTTYLTGVHGPGAFGASTYAPSGYTGLSSGAEINLVSGKGILLTTNYLDNWSAPTNGGIAGGKDQQDPSTGTIRAYVLSIMNGTGIVNLDIKQNASTVSITQHAQSTTATVDPGYTLCGVGGYSTAFTGYGRLLYAMYPVDGSNVIASSKDHIVTDISGTLASFAVGIKPIDW